MENNKQIINTKNLPNGEYNLKVRNHYVIDGPNLINKKNKLTIIIICIIGVIIMIGSFFLIASFGKTKKTSIETTINFNSIQEKSNLTVLSIFVSKTINEDKSDNKLGITASTTFTGKGTFTVDLGKSEFLVDNVRKVLVIKTPPIKMDQDHFTLEYNNIKRNFFNNTFANNSYKDGANIAEKQFKEAFTSIYKTITSNPYFYDTASNAAERLIESYAKSINKNIPDLTVIVEIGAF